MAERRTRGPGAHHEERRNQIADAVLAVVADRGLAAVSLTEVAARAGISPGRVQHYFPAKRQLIEAAFERGNALGGARVRERVGRDLDAAEPRLVLTVVLTELIPYDATTRAHMRVRQSFHAFAFADEEIAARLRVLYAQFHRRLSDLVGADQRAGRLPAGLDAHRAAVTLVALAEGLAANVLIDVTPAATARESVLAAIAGLYDGRDPYGIVPGSPAQR
ncbi:TetR/AcrR family transcriptional regulator [Nonomuraea gerenzanensis]|uniref:Transcriptional regulator, TetR family n=1 Tax=Nonomuraea gerenzanensis TaxID=93944 RepID=A0A1M4EDZ3_9ACTN|nr:TetR family transcriptional regulator C-terminal domain-containing protein [Nonomuraea gerenzanensis]UBU08642.1 TetR family transcriptional regulator C-terminal domain-containing protein [Nonomuraea gerenzanensis]SBO97002.1 Transcriptional regulator, TetR family [Nonomuraea gerenzanensis]